LHWLEAPLRVSVVQTLLSLQDAGQLPSQVSPDSTVPLPQVTEHSPSFVLLQPGAQQPSPLEQAVIAECVHTRVQAPAEPVEPSVVHELPSLQLAGQLPSQVSPDSTTPLPHRTVQLLSFVLLQPGAQQPSPFLHCVMSLCPHWTLHDAGVPLVVSIVQALLSLQLAGQLPSQVSPDSTAPLPHRTVQSLSFVLLQPGAQQPSPPAH